MQKKQVRDSLLEFLQLRGSALLLMIVPLETFTDLRVAKIIRPFFALRPDPTPNLRTFVLGCHCAGRALARAC
jgi:hypothetical protein